MRTKTKTIVAILAIFILTGIVIGYYYKTKQKPIRNEPPVQIVEQKPVTTPEEKVAEQTSENTEVEINTTVAKGTVSAVDEMTVTAQTSDGEIIFNILDSTSVYYMVKGKPIYKSISDLKVNSKIVFQYDIASKNALAIKLMP